MTQDNVTQLQTQQPNSFSLTPRTLDEAYKMAELMAQSDMVPQDFRNKPGNVLVAVQMGAEIGLPPTQAIQNIAVVNGRPSLWGDGALAVVQAHPKFVSIKEEFDDKTMTAYCTIVRKGEESHTTSFSKADAEIAGLWSKKGPWQQYPKRMLKMRARGEALRDKFADALKGISVAEEVQDIQERPARDMGSVERDQSTEKPSTSTSRLASQLQQKAQGDDAESDAIDGQASTVTIDTVLNALTSAKTPNELHEAVNLARQLEDEDEKEAAREAYHEQLEKLKSTVS